MAKSTVLCLPLLAFITTSLLFLPKAYSKPETVKFNFPEFDDEAKKHLTLQGDAVIDDGVLQLTKVDSDGTPRDHSVGRVLYTETIHLYHSGTRKVAGFKTSFHFIITSPSSPNNPGDGITFFITTPDSNLPLDSSGGLLGLFSNPNALRNNSSRRSGPIGFRAAATEKVVAVEFDTFVNEWDPDYRHVGVDANSIRSRGPLPLPLWDWKDGDEVSVSIIYDPFDKELHVNAIDLNNPGHVEFSVYIDLVKELPDRVKVGLSASTGEQTEINTITSWSFEANLESASAAEEDGHLASVV